MNFTIAIVGLGPMGQRHLKALKENFEFARIVGLCDLNKETVLKSCEQIKGAKGFICYQEMLAKVTPDVICVATNAPSHAEIVSAAAQARVKNIVVEKPITTSVRSARQIIEICKEQGVRLAVNHSRRFFPTYQRVREVIKKGLLGEVYDIDWSCPGGLSMIGTHFFDNFRYLTGLEAQSIVGIVDHLKKKNPRGEQYIDPGGFSLIQFEGGMRGILRQNEDAAGPMLLSVNGTSGRILLDEQMNRVELLFRDRSIKPGPGIPIHFEDRSAEIGPFEGGMFQALRDLYSNLLSQDPLICSGEDGAASLEMFVATHFSSRCENRSISLPLSDSKQIDELFPIT